MDNIEWIYMLSVYTVINPEHQERTGIVLQFQLMIVTCNCISEVTWQPQNENGNIIMPFKKLMYMIL